jgi:acyl-homoserine-lactone acylase
MSRSINLNSKFYVTTCAALSLVFAACANEASDEPNQRQEIRYTEYGIPHILTNDYESLGFGQGYAQARDNLCKIERGMLAFSGEASRHFGPDAEGTSLLGVGSKNLPNDLYFRALNDSGTVEALVAKPAPLGPRDEVRSMVAGYVQGFNAFLGEAHELECTGAEWVRPMSEIDVYRRVYAVTLGMGQAFLAASIVAAEAPDESSALIESGGLAQALALADGLGDPGTLPGSNAIAIGRDATASSRGINVANPHLAWHGDLRWWQTQLTIPGQLDVSGASMIGVPLIVMGHTKSVSFSITTAEESRRITLFQLELVEGSPTSYLVDGVAEPMQRRHVAVQVKRPDGALETVEKTLWWTRYGPVLGENSPFPLPPWNAGKRGEPGHAYAVADANASNMRMLNTLFAFNHAKSSADILRAIRETQGVPWWTVVAADADGEALLSQVQVLPHLTDEQAERCNTELGAAIFASSGFAILDGSRGECAWGSDPDALEPGIFGPGELERPRLPVARSSRYLENSNNSHWLPSADVRISGMPRIVGDERSERSLRTRGLIAELERHVSGTGYTRALMADTVLSNRSYAADLTLDATVEHCRALEHGLAEASTGQPVDVSAACELLATWDHMMDKQSRGALLFARYFSRATALSKEEGVPLWSVPFDVENPVHTPNTLVVGAPIVARSLADAVLELAAAGIPFDARLGDYQYTVRAGERFPVGGGAEGLGVVNVLNAPFGAEGFSQPFYGSGYMHVVAFDGSPCPDAVTLLTYSQSDEPSSPHHADQTQLYSDKTWVEARFCEDEILASPALEVIQLKPIRAHR